MGTGSGRKKNGDGGNEFPLLRASSSSSSSSSSSPLRRGASNVVFSLLATALLGICALPSPSQPRGPVNQVRSRQALYKGKLIGSSSPERRSLRAAQPHGQHVKQEGAPLPSSSTADATKDAAELNGVVPSVASAGRGENGSASRLPTHTAMTTIPGTQFQDMRSVEESEGTTSESYWALWVGNITPYVQEAQLIKLFGRFGRIKSSVVLPAPDGGDSVAFINYFDESAAQDAFYGLNALPLGGKRLKLRPPKFYHMAPTGSATEASEGRRQVESMVSNDTMQEAIRNATAATVAKWTARLLEEEKRTSEALKAKEEARLEIEALHYSVTLERNKVNEVERMLKESELETANNQMIEAKKASALGSKAFERFKVAVDEAVQLKQQIFSLKAIIKDMENQTQKNISQVREMMRGKLQSAENEKENAIAKKRQLEQKHEELISKTQILQQELKDMRANMLERVDNLRAARAKLQEELAILKTNQSNACTEVQRLLDQVNKAKFEANRNKVQMQKDMKERDNAVRQCKNLQVKERLLEERLKLVEHANDKNEFLHKENMKKIEKLLSEERSKVQALMMEIAESEKKAAEMAILNASILEKVEHFNGALKGARQTLEQTKETHNKEVMGLQEELEKQSQRIKETDGLVGRLQGECKRTQVERNGIEGLFWSQRNRTEDLERRLENLQGENLELRKRIQSIVTADAERKSRSDVSAAAQAAARSALRARQREALQNLVDEISSLRSEVKSLEQNDQRSTFLSDLEDTAEANSAYNSKQQYVFVDGQPQYMMPEIKSRAYGFSPGQIGFSRNDIQVDKKPQNKWNAPTSSNPEKRPTKECVNEKEWVNDNDNPWKVQGGETPTVGMTPLVESEEGEMDTPSTPTSQKIPGDLSPQGNDLEDVLGDRSEGRKSFRQPSRHTKTEVWPDGELCNSPTPPLPPEQASVTSGTMQNGVHPSRFGSLNEDVYSSYRDPQRLQTLSSFPGAYFPQVSNSQYETFVGHDAIGGHYETFTIDRHQGDPRSYEEYTNRWMNPMQMPLPSYGNQYLPRGQPLSNSVCSTRHSKSLPTNPIPAVSGYNSDQPRAPLYHHRNSSK